MDTNSEFIIIPANPIDYGLVVSLIHNYPIKEFNAFYGLFTVRNLLMNIESWPGMQKQCFLVYKNELLIGFWGLIIFRGHYIYDAIWYVHPLFMTDKFFDSFDKIITKIAKENNIEKERCVLKSNYGPLIRKYFKKGFYKISEWYSTYGDNSIINFDAEYGFEIQYASENDLKNIKQFLQKSGKFPDNQMYLQDVFPHPLDELNLQELIARNRVIIAYQGDEINGFCVFNIALASDLFPVNVLEICYFNGEGPAFYQLIIFLKNNLKDWSLIKINTVDTKILNSLLKKGFSCEFLNKLKTNTGFNNNKKYFDFLVSVVLERSL